MFGESMWKTKEQQMRHPGHAARGTPPGATRSRGAVARGTDWVAQSPAFDLRVPVERSKNATN